MLKINPYNTDRIINNLLYNQSFDWKCLNCNKINHETEYRNFQRRKILCSCQARDEQFNKIQKQLIKQNYTFLYEEPNSYELTATENIDTKKKILVKCLNCGKISYEYYGNIRTGHKKCNCNEKKKFTRNFSTEDFIKKWHPLNREKFILIDGQNYINRNSKYKIKCKSCGAEDIRWGITLIDSPIYCKYCDNETLGEQVVSSILNKYKITYIREYQVKINNNIHRFDFFIPEYNIYIEYNGHQHYQPIEYFGGEEKFKERVQRDKEKELYCSQDNRKLLIVKYNEKYEDIEKKIGLMFNDYPEKEYTISD